MTHTSTLFSNLVTSEGNIMVMGFRLIRLNRFHCTFRLHILKKEQEKKNHDYVPFCVGLFTLKFVVVTSPQTLRLATAVARVKL